MRGCIRDSTASRQFTEWIRADPWLMEVLRTVRACDLPEWVIGARVLRNLVWDQLHGYTTRTPARDVDVAYFDPLDLSREAESAWEGRLFSTWPTCPGK